MIKVGLTGGIGSGKSYVANVFRHLGVPVFNSDDVARKIQEEDATVKQQIFDAFPEVIEGDTINRKRLAGIVFNDGARLQVLNSIVHPAVGRAFDEFCLQNPAKKYVIKEAAIIFEAGIDEHLDETILITAPEDIKTKRVMQRDSASESEVRSRMTKQWSDEEKKLRADYFIDNDGAKAILPQVLRIHNALLNT